MGPIGTVPEQKERYREERGKVAALERALCVLLRSKNLEYCTTIAVLILSVTKKVWQMMRTAFAEHF